MGYQGGSKRCVYISYSRRSDYSFIQCLIEKLDQRLSLRTLILNDGEPEVSDFPLDQETKELHFDQKKEELERWVARYDQNALGYFGSIRAFMEELSEAEKIIVLLSEGYFRSPYCMVELLHIYRKRSANLMPIVVFLGGLRASGFFTRRSGSFVLGELVLYRSSSVGIFDSQGTDV